MNVLILVALSMAAIAAEPPAFPSLPAAIAAIDDTLSDQDPTRFCALVAHGDPTLADLIFPSLRCRKPLTQIYAGWDFPTTGPGYKVGGHDAELGYVHIAFVHTEKGWIIERMWMCR